MKDPWRNIRRALAEQTAEAARETEERRRLLDPKKRKWKKKR